MTLMIWDLVAIVWQAPKTQLTILLFRAKTTKLRSNCLSLTPMLTSVQSYNAKTQTKNGTSAVALYQMAFAYTKTAFLIWTSTWINFWSEI